MRTSEPVIEGNPRTASTTLSSLAIFAGFPKDELEEIAARGARTTAHPGQVVQAQDVPVRMWHVITSGHAVVHRDDTPIGLLGRGDSWSEHSLLNQLRSTIAVVALSPLTLLTFEPAGVFRDPGSPPGPGRASGRAFCLLSGPAGPPSAQCTGP